VAEGIEFLLELTARLDEATKMVRELNKVELEALQADRALKKAEKQVTLFGKAMGKVKGSFFSAGKAAVGQFAALASFEGLKRVGGAVLNIGEEALHAAGEAQRLRRSFEHLIGDKPADVLLSFLDRLAAKTEFTDGALKGFASQLLRAGFAGESLKRALAGALDLAALSPDKMAGAQEALALFSKVQLKGGVSERELVSAGLSPVAFFKDMAKQLGISVKEVEKRISEGKVKTSVLLEGLFTAITRKTGKDLGGAAVTMAPLFESQLEKAKDIIPNLFEELERTGGLESVTAGLARLVENLSPDSPAGRKIIDGLTAMLDGFGNLIGKVDFDAWSSRLVVAMEIFQGVVGFGVAVVEELGNVFDALTGFGDALGDVLFDVVQGVGDFFNAAKELGAAIWRGIKEGIVSGVTSVTSAVKDLASSAIGGVKEVLGIHSPSAVFAAFGMQTALGFQVGVERALPALGQSMAAAFSPEALMPGLVGLTAAAAAAGPMAAPGPGGPVLHASVVINIGVGQGVGTLRELAQAAEAGARQGLLATLEQLAAEGAGA
jgi:hypothetical protein